MTEIKFNCPNCDQRIGANLSERGNNCNCPNCNCPVVIPPPEVHAGMNIGGFLIKKKIGIGGMGEVWLAEQLSMERVVALKILSPTLVNDGEFVESFIHEIKIVAKLSHPNILTAYDAGEENGIYYLATTFINGAELQDILDKRRRLSEIHSLKVILSVAKALQYAWDKYRIIHRDVKPGNIMIDHDNVVKLMDMGISKSIFEHELNTGMTCGTPNYMSPEQAIDHKGIDFRTDIYSLGITLYRMLAGRMPFIGQSTEEIVNKHIHEAPPNIKVLNKDISDHTANLVKKMISKDKFKRHKSWQEVISETETIIRQLQAPVKSRRKPIIILLLLTVIVLGSSVAVLSRRASVEPVVVPDPIKMVKVPERKVNVRPRKENQRTNPKRNENKRPKNIESPSDKLVKEIKGLLKKLKSSKDAELIKEKIVKLELISTKEENLEFVNVFEEKLKLFEVGHIPVVQKELFSKAEKLFQAGKGKEAIEFLEQYSGEYADKFAEERFTVAKAYREVLQKQQIAAKEANEKRLNQSLATFFRHLMRGELLLAKKALDSFPVDSSVIVEYDEASFVLEKADFFQMMSELEGFNKKILAALDKVVGNTFKIEQKDGSWKNVTIESVVDGQLMISEAVGSSRVYLTIELGEMTLNQRLNIVKNLPVEMRNMIKGLHEIIQNKSIKMAYSSFKEAGPMGKLFADYLHSYSNFLKILVSENVKLSKHIPRKVLSKEFKTQQALKLFWKVEDFKAEHEVFVESEIFKTVYSLLKKEFPINEIFFGSVESFDFDTLNISLNYDFTDQLEENDFMVTDELTLGQTVTIDSGALSIVSKRHANVTLVPEFSELTAEFSGSFRIRDFDCALLAKNKNIAYVGHGFGGATSANRDGIIRNWKLSDAEYIEVADSSLTPNSINNATLHWDGDVVAYDIDGKVWQQEIFFTDRAKFALLSFGSTNSYNNLKVSGTLSKEWLIDFLKERTSAKED